ncbi:hypothetical protein RhiirA1_464661 [Rhizophagus irregularis]|uniref:F-box domain-containing protein n=3 Tax=Rhizophagus irregularis TaxID=588596 RepID=A0A2I1GM61_9GLOM|nr:hypothetical protein RirG_014390 [Rhizophagus irregularis DAOM 197198w]PKC62792.1 hypothetical protein RhiirA1_464661 [Rhizophagus irregularis]GET53967.1 hypothetical protein GLOIN_2v1876445 [Rhizophagus irregularis DAOM 181602=DAOM 197198]PKK61949.1 hypothetical protein RhiirC2_791088 [Rhizophagus irregularis]PKY17311.1 hypothetical protein RhiirB3_429903 [Rhizophagus irregularis]
MSCQLPADCLNEIFEYLEKDKVTLHSCLLVNRLWCEISVRILWRNIWIPVGYEHRLKVETSILNTLIACLPNKSKTHLLEKGILNSTQISKSCFFDYPSFCKVLSIHMIGQMIIDVFKNQKYLAKEIMKMFMTRSYLKKLSYYNNPNTLNLSFIRYPRAKDCFTRLTKLTCSSDIKSVFFYKLSQISFNIQSLTIEFNGTISEDLKNLIISQNNLKNLSLSQPFFSMTDWSDIIPSLIKHSNTIIKLKIYWEACNLLIRTKKLSFITKFLNLQELVLSFQRNDHFDEINNILQYSIFPHLQILKFPYRYPKVDILIKFLKNNGKNLKEFYINYTLPILPVNDLLNLKISRYCPNLKLLSTLFKKVESLKIFFNRCQQLECFETHYNYGLSERDILGALAEYSPKNFFKLKLLYYSYSQLTPDDLEEFFINWKNRLQQKSFYFTMIGKFNNIDDSYINRLKNDENMKMIEKYKKLGIIKKFEIINH